MDMTFKKIKNYILFRSGSKDEKFILRGDSKSIAYDIRTEKNIPTSHRTVEFFTADVNFFERLFKFIVKIFFVR